MFKDFFSFLKGPYEYCNYSYKPKDLLQTLLLFILIAVGSLLFVLGVKVFLGLCFPKLIAGMSDNIHPHEYVWWVPGLLGPLLEECTFRLPLHRRKTLLFVGLSLLAFEIISKVTYTHLIYTTDHLLLRLGLGLAAGALLTLLLCKPILRCHYGTFFYLSAITFGLVHSTNGHFSEFLPLDYVVMLAYLIKQTLMGVILGYARLRHGLPASVALHMLNNLI